MVANIYLFQIIVSNCVGMYRHVDNILMCLFRAHSASWTHGAGPKHRYVSTWKPAQLPSSFLEILGTYCGPISHWSKQPGEFQIQLLHWPICKKIWKLFFNIAFFFQVRKTSQAALLVLLEQGLLSKADMETKVCPVLLELTEPSSDDDYKIEAVAVRNMSFIFFWRQTV